MKTILPLLLSAVMLMGFGCRHADNPNGFIHKSEEELAEMDDRNAVASEAFRTGNYNAAQQILDELLKEKTVSSPLFQLEMISLLLMTGQRDAAHELMLRTVEDLEFLFDKESEEKAQSLWCGENNKVFRGDGHERATLYALLALSFMQKGNYEDAIRCVKNGLLADSDAAEEKHVSDYALLHYIGMIASLKSNLPDDAAEYRREMDAALTTYGIDHAALPPVNRYTPLAQTAAPNALVILWAGTPPSMVHQGEYDEIRSVLNGKNPFDLISVEIDDNSPLPAINAVGDVNYQATTRGGRLMDSVLADKAMAKRLSASARNIFLIAGFGLCIAGGASMSNLAVGISLLSAGGCCLLIGGTIHVIGLCINSTADIRYWRNLPCEFYLLPLHLTPGKHSLFVTGFHNYDVIATKQYDFDVSATDPISIIHLPLLNQGESASGAIEVKLRYLRKKLIKDADKHPMKKAL